MWIFPSESHALSLEEAAGRFPLASARDSCREGLPLELCALFTAHAKDELGYYHSTIKAAHIKPIVRIGSVVNGKIQPEGVGHASSIGFERLG